MDFDPPAHARRATVAALVALAAAMMSGCAGLPAARMALPAELGAVAPEPIRGLGAARSGPIALDGGAGRFERSATRLTWFDSIENARGGVRYTWAPVGAAETTADCRARQRSVTLGVLSADPRPFELRCEFAGAVPGRLTLTGSALAGASGRVERNGRADFGRTAFEVRSVHRVEGSPLPLAAPIGYVFLEGGRAVGAVEMNGPTPRLWRPADSPRREAVTQAALALALLWDPASSP